MKDISGGVTAPRGFLAAGMYCGIKKKVLPDLALIVSEETGPIAGVFTLNRVAAAPVLGQVLGVALDVGADHEEGRAGVQAVQHVQEVRRVGIGAVVEGQGDAGAAAGATQDQELRRQQRLHDLARHPPDG